MGSKKRSARERQRAAFEYELGSTANASSMADLFSREERRKQDLSEKRDAARRFRSCESKNRYATRAEAEAAIASCERWGKRGLRCYRCSHCKGWHLTSHPQEG